MVFGAILLCWVVFCSHFAFMLRLLMFSFLCCFAVPAFAQVVADPKQAWRAMGTLFVDEREYCKVSLVNETMAITAAHCVTRPEGGVMSTQNLAVVFPGRTAVSVIDIALVPDFRYESLDAAPFESLAGDVAVVYIEPVRDVLPINLIGFDGLTDSDVWVPGNKWQLCRARPTLDPDIFHVACPLPRGDSGRPILRIDSQGIHIVGVVTAQDPFEGGIYAHSIHIALARMEWVYGGPDKEG